MIPVFAHPEIAARMQDDIRRAMEVEVLGRVQTLPARRSISPKSRTGQLLRLMRSAPDVSFTARQLADALGCRTRDLTPAFDILVKREDIIRVGRNAGNRILYRANVAVCEGAA